MKSKFVALFFFLLLAIPASAEEAHVLRVIDGDSLRIELRGLEMDLRLLGIDAPEWNTPGGPKAKAFVQAWVDKAGGHHRPGIRPAPLRKVRPPPGLGLARRPSPPGGDGKARDWPR